MNALPNACRTIAVTGANGFVGRALCARLADRGHHVVALTRTSTRVAGAQEQRLLDTTGPIARDLFASCDAVVNCAARVHVTRRENPALALAAYRAINCDLALEFAERARDAGVSRFVQISSVAAIGTSPVEILRDGDHEEPTTPYGIAKLAADRALADLASPRFAVISLRPPAVFGPGAAAWFAKLMAAARIGLPLPVGRIQNLRSFAYVDNVADAVCLATGHSQSISGSFVVTDSAPLSTAKLYRKLLTLCGKPDRVWNWPAGGTRFAATMALGDRANSLVGNAAYDGSRFAREFGWQPPIGFDEALRITMAEKR